MQVARLAGECDGYFVATLVGAVASVERLLQVAYQMRDEAQRELLAGQRSLWIADSGRETLERGHRITFGWRADSSVCLALWHGNIMPRAGGVLPELARVRPHEVGPGRCFGQCFEPKDALYARRRAW